MNTPHMRAYAAAVKHHLPHWNKRQCFLATLTHFATGKVHEAAYDELGPKLYEEYRVGARNKIHQWDRWAVYLARSLQYVHTAYSRDNARAAIERARAFRPELAGRQLVAVRLELTEPDPFYL